MHTGRSLGSNSVKKIWTKKMKKYVQKFKNLTKFLLIFNNFSLSHQSCDFDDNCFFGDPKHSLKNLDQNLFLKIKEKKENFEGFLKKPNFGK